MQPVLSLNCLTNALMTSLLARLTYETLDLITKRLRFADPPPVVVTRQLDIARLWDMTGKISSSLYWNTPISTPMEHQRWHSELSEQRANVGITHAR